MASIWWPRQMPISGLPLSSSFLISGTAYSPVAAGSPGPFDSTTPSGSRARMSSAVVEAGTTVIFTPVEARARRMLRFTP